ncbi:phage tail tape measure protein [Paraclostridium bifermentans]|uniref:phage tail tape measure protein n=1 Tax=Paraclostridium bifermentans TaxID=1490 RepID=UPI001C7E4660|nr:phage tail tape measure protein [Paraclostridium bifermentans]GIM32969.1 phage tail tape measure protein [Paraclostridium bifermentans subsp. muricolitidis]
MAANIKIKANSSDFQRQMKEMATELKKVSSSYNLANTQAKLFGSSTDVLKSKQSELTSKIKIQNSMVEAQSNHLKKLNKDISQQKSEQSTLGEKIDATNKRYKESVAQTGKNSEESKKLKKELDSLKEEYAKNEKAIDSNSRKLDNAEIKLNNSKKALMENEKALKDINKELEKTKLEKFNEKLDSASKKAEGISNKMKPASLAITGFGFASANASLKFEDSIANINTLLDDTSHLESYKNKIISVSDETGMSIQIVADGMYQAISSIGDGGKETEKIFEDMAKGAKAGEAEVSDAVSLISAGMKGYGDVNDETAKKISDLAFQTAKLGVTTFPEMASSMQPLFPLSKSLDISLEELFGSMATLTGVTGNTSEVSTQLKAVFSNLMKPTKDMQKLIEKYGYSNSQAMLKSEGLQGVLKILQKETGGQADKLGKLFSSTEAVTAITALTGENFKDFTTKTKEMGNASGATEKALKKKSDTIGQDLRNSLNLAQNALIGFGDALSPLIALGAKALSLVSKAIGGMSKGQKDLVMGFGATFVATNLAIGGFAKLSKGLSSNIKFVKDTSKSVKDYVKATKEGTSGIAKFGKGITSASKTVITFSTNLAKGGVKAATSFGKGILTVSKNIGSLSLALLKNTGMLVKNGLQWTLSKAKMIAYKTAQVAVTGATKAMALAQQGLNLVLSMNPIGLVIIALTSLGAIFVVLYNKCEWFRNGVNQVWNGIKNTFIGFANFFKGAFKTDFTQTFGLLGVPLNSFFGVVNAIWGGVKGVFDGILTFLGGVFTGNWKKIFKGLSDIVSSIFGAIGGIIKAPINAAISGINAAIRGVNKISFTVPEWVPGIGGNHFGVHLPQIPALAEGGIVTKATMALVGEGKEHEAVIPLSKLDKLVTDSVSKVLKSNSSETEGVNQSKSPKLIQVYFQLGSKIVAQAIYDEYGNLISKNQSSRSIARGKVQHV